MLETAWLSTVSAKHAQAQFAQYKLYSWPINKISINTQEIKYF